MYREITADLLKWKDHPRRKPLLLTGVRQCGKTYTVTRFAEENFQNHVHINFERNEKASAIFDYDFDVHRIVSEIEMLMSEKITPGETLVFFDEIQQCSRAITSLKYFCEDMRDLHIVCAGSLLGVALKRESISFPVGKVNRMSLYPMNFKEFVIANARADLIDIFSDWKYDRPVPELYDAPMRKLLKDYYIVGGMPEAVKTWIDTGNYSETEDVQRDILRDYGDDFAKYAPLSEVPKIRWIWESIPVQLAKENNKFIFSHVKKGKRSAELEDAMQWLRDAGLIVQLNLVEKLETPLSGFEDKTYFKVYMSDIGLLRVRSGISPETILNADGLYVRYKGAFTENYVLNEFISNGIVPYFWRSGNTAEIDFIYENKGQIIPVEVKSADNTQAKSYRQFCKKYKPKRGYKLSEKNVGVNMSDETETYSLPLYMSWRVN